MSKRGQITVFIIAGILILAAAGTYLFLNKEFAKKNLNQEDGIEAASIHMFVNNCLEKSTVDALYKVLSRGGYNEYPVDLDLFSFTEDEEVFETPYYFKENQVSLPSKTFIEKEISAAVEEFFVGCAGNYEAFKESGFIIEPEELKVITVFSGPLTRISADYPLTISKGETTTSYSQFAVNIPFNFEQKYWLVEELLNDQEQNSDEFLIGKVSKIAEEQNFYYGFQQFGEFGEDILFNLIYDEGLEEEPIIYSFSLHFDWEEEPKISEQLPFEPDNSFFIGIKYLEEWNISLPGIFTYQVEADGEGLTFSTDPDSLPIDSKSGLITVNTNEFPNDEYLYYVLVENILGLNAVAPFLININVNQGNLPIIQQIPNQEVKVGEEFKFLVNVINRRTDDLIFTSESDLFEINETTGEISFVPLKDQIGIHTARVNVENNLGRTWQRWEVEIK